MPRDWNGSVFKTPGRETWSAKWKEFGYAGGEWRVRRGFATKTEANDFLADKRREYRARRRGDWDEFTVPKRQPIAQHVGDFHAHILANRRRRDGARSEKHADLTRSRIERAFKELKVRCLGDLVGARVDQWLAEKYASILRLLRAIFRPIFLKVLVISANDKLAQVPM